MAVPQHRCAWGGRGWLCPRAAEMGTSGEVTQAELTRGPGDAAASPTKREDAFVCCSVCEGFLKLEFGCGLSREGGAGMYLQH